MPAIAPDSALAKLPDDTLIYVLAGERLELIGYGRQAEAVIAACR